MMGVYIIEKKVQHFDMDGDSWELYNNKFYQSRQVAEMDARSHFKDGSEWRTVFLVQAALEKDLLEMMEEE